MSKTKALTLVSVLFMILYFAFSFNSQPVTYAEESRPDFPVFKFENVVIDPDDMNYNPTNEYDFPTVIKAHEYFETPLGKYYMYYGPHDSPGGISLAYADSLEGPWTEYDSNPIVSNQWEPHYDVSHVASAHPIWNEEEGKLFLYFHGENTTTRLATSEDGIHFEYEKEVVTTADFNDISEASYARVFEYTIPDKQNKYIMMLMGNNNGNRKIYLAWSDDGREWETRRDPIISPIANGEIDHKGNLSGAYYFPWNGKHYVTVHASSGNQYFVEVGENFDQEIHHGAYYESTDAYPEDGRAASRSYIQEGDTTYMFYEVGQRGSTKIALAKSVPKDELENLGTVTISTESTTLLAKNTIPLELDLKLNNGEVVNADNVKLEYFSSDPDTATTINGEIYGFQEGNADIWVRATLNGNTVESNKLSIHVIDEHAAWNIIDDDLLNFEDGWSITKGRNTTGTITQNEGFVTIQEDRFGTNGTYHYLTKTNFSIPTDSFTFEVRAKVNAVSTGNEFSIRNNGRVYPLFVSYNGDIGFVKNRISNPTESITLDTNEYHTYRVIVHSDSTYEVLVDGEYAWSGTSRTDSSSNLIKIGADSPATANMDLDYIKLGTGELLPKGDVTNLREALDFYRNSGDLQLPLHQLLSNKVMDFEHHFNKGHGRQAVKHLNDFIKHLENKGLAKFVSERAKIELIKDVDRILHSFE